MAYTAIAYVVVAYIVIAYTVMAYINESNKKIKTDGSIAENSDFLIRKAPSDCASFSDHDSP